jgi:hypothetical protein
MAAVVYLLFDMAGIVDQVNSKVLTSNKSHYVTEIKIVSYYDLSIMKDPKQNEIKIYRGAIKKTTLDGWEHLINTELKLEMNDVPEDVLLTVLAKVYGGNIVIINSSGAYSTATSRAVRH